MRKPIFLFLFLVAIPLGWWMAYYAISNQSNNGHGARIPAAIQSDFDFSDLSGKDLKLATSERLLEDIKVVSKNDLVGIQLGHFVVSGESGSKEFGCDYYDRVQLTFIAEGIAENGVPPELVVDGPCSISENINRMEPVWLPVSEMLEMSPATVKGYFFSVHDVFIDLRYIGTVWPREWRLDRVEVLHQGNFDRKMAADSKLVKSYFTQPFMMSWDL